MNHDIEKIERWLRDTGMSESRLGLLAAANQRAVARIRQGSAQVATLQAVLRYIDATPRGRPSHKPQKD